VGTTRHRPMPVKVEKREGIRGPVDVVQRKNSKNYGGEQPLPGASSSRFPRGNLGSNNRKQGVVPSGTRLAKRATKSFESGRRRRAMFISPDRPETGRRNVEEETIFPFGKPSPNLVDEKIATFIFSGQRMGNPASMGGYKEREFKSQKLRHSSSGSVERLYTTTELWTSCRIGGNMRIKDRLRDLGFLRRQNKKGK